MNTKTALAVFKRNFYAYFASPTGYAFICVFVLLCAFAAFWPAAFFNMNLANLGQLNKAFPLIMLIFIPAITMSSWADERRQGTDELLLTLPAKDIDIVAGKFAAAVGIYSVSLLFSAVCLYSVLAWLGNPDLGLFLSTFIGYWFVGVAMLALGMTASFLTANLTMAYIFGVLFNAPLVFAAWGRDLLAPDFGKWISQWSLGKQFDVFGRGLFSFSAMFYFLAIASVALYLCMILIGRRHWTGAVNSWAKALHFTVRIVALAAIAVGLTSLVSQHDFQGDLTVEKLNSMTPQTRKLIDSVEAKRPVKIEAFLSDTVPQRFVQTKLQIERLLHEIASRGGKKVQVNINYLTPFSPEALLAEKQFGIRPKSVQDVSRDLVSVEEIFMSVVFSSGMEQNVVPFIDPGMSVDYELSRALATVTKQQRKRIGIVRTDVQVFSGIDFTAMQNTPDWKIVEELKSTYNVEEIDPNQAIDATAWDALICVQPSSFGPEELDNFLTAVKEGVPTVIFEDPVPVFDSSIPGTSQPRRPPGNPMMSMMMQQQAPPKCDIEKLWSLLNIEFSSDACLAQSFNPIPIFTEFPPQFVFIDKGAGEPQPFDKALAATQSLQRVLMPAPGSIIRLNDIRSKVGTTGSALDQVFLMRTGPEAGLIPCSKLFSVSPMGARAGLNVNAPYQFNGAPLDTAVWVKSKDWKRPTAAEKAAEKAAADKMAKTADVEKAKTDKTEAEVKPKPEAKAKAEDAAKTAEGEPKPEKINLNVIVTADIDLLHDAFFQLRNQVLEEDIRFDNVAYVLNVIDMAAGEDAFFQIRSHRPEHRMLTKINNLTKAVRNRTDQETAKLEKEYEQKITEENERIQTEANKLTKKIQEQGLDQMEILQRVGLLQRDMEKRVEAQKEQFQREKESKLKVLQTEFRTEVTKAQDNCKMLAVVLPPILPLVLAIWVFIYRRMGENVGANRNRLKK